MSDPQQSEPSASGSPPSAASEEIARSLGSVWQRFAGQRPRSTSVEIDKNTVRCVIEEGSPDADADAVGEVDDASDPRVSPDSHTYKHNATAAVARATGRDVVAFIPKRDKKAETSTQTFILERPRRRN